MILLVGCVIPTEIFIGLEALMNLFIEVGISVEEMQLAFIIVIFDCVSIEMPDILCILVDEITVYVGDV